MLSKAKSRYIIREIIKLFPDAKPSLDFTNVFELLVAVMLSAQTTDAAVNKVTPALFERFPNPLVLAQADPKEIEPYISKIGLYRNKARFLNQCAKQLIEHFDGKVPRTRQELESLAGVGRKTANVVMSVGICKQSASPLEIEKRVMEVLPPEEWLAAHQSMIYFGRAICHPKNPKCDQYPQLYHFPDNLK